MANYERTRNQRARLGLSFWRSTKRNAIDLSSVGDEDGIAYLNFRVRGGFAFFLLELTRRAAKVAAFGHWLKATVTFIRPRAV